MSNQYSFSLHLLPSSDVDRLELSKYILLCVSMQLSSVCLFRYLNLGSSKISVNACDVLFIVLHGKYKKWISVRKLFFGLHCWNIFIFSNFRLVSADDSMLSQKGCGIGSFMIFSAICLLARKANAVSLMSRQVFLCVVIFKLRKFK